MTSTWDNSPAPATQGGWQPDNSGPGLDAWNTDGDTADDNFDGEISAANISKHAGAGDGGCRICGDEGHFARDCPDKKPNTGECYNCGQEGHAKAECPNPRVEREFTGTCRACQETGHRAAECPNKPPEACKVCKQEGHAAKDCEVNRVHAELASLSLDGVRAEDAWATVVIADNEKDVADIKQAILNYSKLNPESTLPQIEEMLRAKSMNTFLIAKQQEISDTHTIVDLQGKLGQKYVLSFQFSAMPRRAKFREGWPPSKEENLARLSEAGFVMDAFVIKCINCGEIGHMSKSCEQEKRQPIEIIPTCANCDATGHRARNCPEPRKTFQKSCRICEGEGHMAKDCPQRVPEKCRNCDEEGHRAADCTNERVIKCRNCDAVGHTAKECDQPRDMSRVKCRNCDEMGHTSRDCPKPTDWSRVQCTNCQEMGHSYKRCKKETKDTADDTAGDSGWGNTDADNHGDNKAPAGGDQSWGGAVQSNGGW